MMTEAKWEWCSMRKIWLYAAYWIWGWKGPWAKEHRQLLEAGKGKEIASSLELPEKTKPCQHLDFNPMRPVLNYQTPKMLI